MSPIIIIKKERERERLINNVFFLLFCLFSFIRPVDASLLFVCFFLLCVCVSVAYQVFLSFVYFSSCLNRKRQKSIYRFNFIVNEDMIDEVLHIDDDPTKQISMMRIWFKKNNYRIRNWWNYFTKCAIYMWLMNTSIFCW